MRVPHGVTVTVSRDGGRDAYGDLLPGQSWTIPKVGVDWASPTDQTGEFREQSVTEIQVFIPRSSQPVRQGDKVTLPGGSRWVVVGSPLWDQVHPLTGTDFGLVEVKLRAVL